MRALGLFFSLMISIATRTFVSLLFLLSLSAAITARGDSWLACEMEALKPGGRTYLRLLRSGLASHDLNSAHLDEILKHQEPFHPVVEDRLTTNLALRDGFTRALKHLQKEEWPLVLEFVERLRTRQKQEANLVNKVRQETRYYFDFRPTGIQLEEGALDPETFVSSKGEIFIYTSERGRPILWEFLTNRKTPLPPRYSYQVKFFETSKGQVLLMFRRDDGKTLSVYDARVPGKPYFEFEFSRAKALQPYISHWAFEQFGFHPIEVNGHVKIVSYFNITRGQVPEVPAKPMLVIDLLAEAHTVVHLLNVNSGYGVAGDGRFYAVTGWRDEEANTGTLSVRDVLSDQEVFCHNYGGIYGADRYKNIPDLSLSIAGDAADEPCIYLGHGRDPHGKVDRLNREMVRLKPERNWERELFYDRKGRANFAFLEDLNKGGFFIGQSERYEHFDFPKGNPYLPELKVIDGTYGNLLIFSDKTDDNFRRLKAFHLFNRERNEWVMITASDRWDISHLQERPFYDRAGRRILGWMKSKDRQWLLMRFYGQ